MIISHPAGWDIGEILPYSGTMCNDELIVVESVFEGTILPKRRLLTDETYSRDGKFYHAIEYVVNNDTIYVDGLQPKDVQRMFKQ